MTVSEHNRRPNRDRLASLVLARLFASKNGRSRESEIKRALFPFVRHVYSAAEWASELEGVLDELAGLGMLGKKPLELTPDGRARVRRTFGIDHAVSWKMLKSTYLAARALDQKPSKNVGADQLRAAILTKHHGVAAQDKLGRTIDALVWRELGIASTEPLTLDKLRATLLGRMLGSKRELDFKKVKHQLVANAAGTTKSDAETLRTAVVKRWLCDTHDSAADHETAAAPSERDNLDAFATAVLDAARSSNARFGESQVFISGLWQRLRDDPRCAAMDLDAFKQRLVEANRAGLIRLERADLVAAMDPRAVRESETQYLNATFHFVQIEPGRIQ